MPTAASATSVSVVTMATPAVDHASVTVVRMIVTVLDAVSHAVTSQAETTARGFLLLLLENCQPSKGQRCQLVTFGHPGLTCHF